MDPSWLWDLAGLLGAFLRGFVDEVIKQVQTSGRTSGTEPSVSSSGTPREQERRDDPLRPRLSGKHTPTGAQGRASERHPQTVAVRAVYGDWIEDSFVYGDLGWTDDDLAYDPVPSDHEYRKELEELCSDAEPDWEMDWDAMDYE